MAEIKYDLGYPSMTPFLKKIPEEDDSLKKTTVAYKIPARC